MIRTDQSPNTSAVFGVNGQATNSLAAAGAPERFGDFSAFEAKASVGLGQTTASADLRHAARTVASFLVES